MNDDDEIWADEDEPTGSSEQYDAMLVDIKDQDSPTVPKSLIRD